MGVDSEPIMSPRELCSRAAELAADFPRGQPVGVDSEAEVGVVMTQYWNVALPRAAGLLARSLIDMAARGMTETILVRRALMELYTNLAVLNLDPQRAVRYAMEQQVSNERMLARLRQHDVGSAEELGVKAAQLDEARAQIEEHGLDPSDIRRYEPFGMSTKERFEAAGLHDAYYDILYSTASDYAHMNARAVERVLDDDFDEASADAELAIATDFLIRILRSANDKLGTDLGPDIERLKDDYTAADAAVQGCQGGAGR